MTEHFTDFQRQTQQKVYNRLSKRFIINMGLL